MFFTVFPILSYSHSNTHATTYIGYNKPYGKPIKFTIKLYVDHNTLWVKKATHQKDESLKGLERCKRHVNVIFVLSQGNFDISEQSLLLKTSSS